jgi:hypothetical protein
MPPRMDTSPVKRATSSPRGSNFPRAMITPKITMTVSVTTPRVRRQAPNGLNSPSAHHLRSALPPFSRIAVSASTGLRPASGAKYHERRILTAPNSTAQHEHNTVLPFAERRKSSLTRTNVNHGTASQSQSIVSTQRFCDLDKGTDGECVVFR